MIDSVVKLVRPSIASVNSRACLHQKTLRFTVILSQSKLQRMVRSKYSHQIIRSRFSARMSSQATSRSPEGKKYLAVSPRFHRIMISLITETVVFTMTSYWRILIVIFSIAIGNINVKAGKSNSNLCSKSFRF